MKTYELYRSRNNLKAIKCGPSFPAFFFTWIWALIKGLWLAAIVLFALSFLFGLGLQTLSITPLRQASTSTLYTLIPVIYWLIAGIIFATNGNKWLGHKLRRQGYQLVTTVTANSKAEAIRQFDNT